MVTLPFKMGSLQWVSLFYHLLLSLSIVALGAIALGGSEPWLLLQQTMPDPFPANGMQLSLFEHEEMGESGYRFVSGRYSDATL
jgi:hypothetical protein